MLINSYHDRMAIAVAKKRKILNFLRDETWSNLKNLALLCDSNISNMHSTLKTMQRDHFLIPATYNNLGGKFTLWGLTPQGLDMSFEDQEVVKRSYFRPEKINIATINHSLDLQVAQIKAENANWTNWINGRYLFKENTFKRPDAAVTSPEGLIVAIELERTVKTRKRYQQIIANYLQLIKQKKYDQVIYLSPENIFKILKPLFSSVTVIFMDDEPVTINEKDRDCFKFYSLEQWLT